MYVEALYVQVGVAYFCVVFGLEDDFASCGEDDTVRVWKVVK